MITTGLDQLLEDLSPLEGKRAALVANQTSVTSSLTYSWDALKQSGIELKRLFSPEHGLFSTEQDQVAVTLQPETGCETVSLYGSDASSLKPDAELLNDIDILIFDIQDVGTRYYTYVNTLALIMEVLDGTATQLLVLDRPNPLGGISVEGPMPDPAYRSFVGILPVPVRHGMTAGELAHLYQDYRKIDLDLTVITMQGWKRDMLFRDTGLFWVPPSPNMPTPETALVYPGMCLFEGLNCSEGRGTTTPFELAGAPFIDPLELTRHPGLRQLEGVIFRPTWFKPSFHKYSNEICGGICLHVSDHQRFDAFAAGIALTSALHELYPEKLRFLDDIYEFNSTYPAFDLLCGSGTLRTLINAATPLSDLRSSWLHDLASFMPQKETFHLY
ncbi:DUF1343 domain-containing protein [Prosthecochloris sp. ZM_2]|uniref:exo-beta-N-acetylmuramidase NamZ family protein n=1 Tax=Prosthecochloris sp. ZM_2 TaxID=2045206 RepID=UPI000DF81904|nr:DUF1343 domain-containing protein [Prosthecochloris sp. ZM_2]RNA64180.1 DUF1343 domain-containing protein [Prosthecochloris sp. ZM_2]